MATSKADWQVVSFRLPRPDVRKVDRKAKGEKLTRAEWVEAKVRAALDNGRGYPSAEKRARQAVSAVGRGPRAVKRPALDRRDVTPIPKAAKRAAR